MVPASAQTSQLSWIVGSLSAYAETHWLIFSTYDTCRLKLRHKLKRQLERTVVLCISLFKPKTSFKDGCVHKSQVMNSGQGRKSCLPELWSSPGLELSQVLRPPLAFLSHPSLISKNLPWLRSWTCFQGRKYSFCTNSSFPSFLSSCAQAQCVLSLLCDSSVSCL